MRNGLVETDVRGYLRQGAFLDSASAQGIKTSAAVGSPRSLLLGTPAIERVYGKLSGADRRILLVGHWINAMGH